MRVAGYEITGEISRDDRFAIYRGVRGRDGQPVLLKMPTRKRAAGEPEPLLREYELLSRLSVPGVPRALEFIDAATPCLVLEDAQLQPLRSLVAGRQCELEPFFKMAIPLCGILADLHRQDIVHGGVSPFHIWTDTGLGKVQLLDFTRAWTSSDGAQATPPADVESLAYASPEQTGRMNCAPDHRTDFYSLGATFYELLAGARPFRAVTALELVHSHIAKAPAPLAELAPHVPEQVCEIAGKLLAKVADDRYRSAAGIQRDLEECRRQWSAGGSIAPFALAARDVSDRFLIPHKLYGRQREIETLTEAFDRVCEGPASAVLVSGYSGIGKTALIQELYKPIVRQRGYFASGKFDQVVRNVPYGGLIQAFRRLLSQLLAESEEQLGEWRSRLSGALGGNAGVLAEVIPEIELILGKCAPADAVGPLEAQNRFRLVFENFVAALARPAQPLVIFLDDLQWADSASLGLLQPLLTNADLRYLLLVGAYRDNEIDASHVLTPALRAIEGLRGTVSLELRPLAFRELAALVRDTLQGEWAKLEPLTRVIAQKTDGNPFFVIQFLKTLRQENLLRFDDAKGRWTFHIEAIAQAAIADNVVDLMTRKIRLLSSPAQRALTLGSCIGSRFEARTLAAIGEQPLEEAAACLDECAKEGLLLRTSEGNAYAFLHDRVQQAAYGMIPEDRRQRAHLKLGRLLRSRHPGEADEGVFDVAQHLNRARALIADPVEQLALARLNLAAVRKAKSSAAYHSALEYARTALELLNPSWWVADYDFAWNLTFEAAECEYLCGRFDQAEVCFNRLLEHSRNNRERAEIHRLRIVQNENMSRYDAAVQCGREGLALFGLSFPDSPEEKQARLETAVSAIDALVAGKPIQSLVTLPAMQDPEQRIIMRLLTSVWAPAYLAGDQDLTRLISATMVRLSLEHGSAEESAYGYVTHAITVGPVRGDYQSAYEWGALALAVNEHLNDARRRAKVHQQFNAHVSLWRRPLEVSIRHAREARRAGLETGDFTYAGYGALTESWSALLAARTLDEFVRDGSANLAVLDKIRMSGMVQPHRVVLNWAHALAGRTASKLSLSTEGFEEAQYISSYGAHPFSMTIYCVMKLMLSFTFEDYAGALEYAAKARGLIDHLSGTIWPVYLDFYGGLAIAARHRPGEPPPPELASISARMELLAKNCPENFGGFYFLLRAEIDRLCGRDLEAMDLYERAIRVSHDANRISIAALANELCARFWRARGNEAIARLYWCEAARVYAAWGAAAKASDLEERYSIAAEPAPRPSVSFDIDTVIKASRAIAAEVVTANLLEKLMRIALENAGARRGVFVREKDAELVIEAEGSVDPEEVRVLEGMPLSESSAVCSAVLRYARKTGECTVIADALKDERFSEDPYVKTAAPRSILCAPVVYQGKLAGILYLENNLAPDVFTAGRLRIIQLLCAQAAIALENARIYDEMKQEVTRRRAAEGELRAALAEVESLKKRLEAENVYLREEIRTEHNFEEIVGNSPAILAVLQNVERVAPTDAIVLISGETGTGKELIARAVHNRSARKQRPLVKVNCGAISAGLVESELFGHVRGAFTGALERRTGRFEVADGGTLFLDEVGELPLDTQVKLLRVLQEGEFEPVGSSRSQRVDVRVIAATNRDLGEAVRQGRFRADLYYRLNVFPIPVPALRERPEDIPMLVTFLASRFAKKFGKRIDAIAQDSLNLLVRYSWPGNIRELQNLVERAVVLAQGTILTLDPATLPSMEAVERIETRTGIAVAASAAGTSSTAGASLEEVERRHILTVLERSGWVIEGASGAARALEMHANTLRSRMKKLGIRRPTH